MTTQPPLFHPPKTRESLSNDIWRACDILRRDNNCGGIMEYVEHLSWLLFLRFLDAQEEVWEAEAALDGVQDQVAELKRLQAESAAELERLSEAVLAGAFGGEI